MQRLLCGLCTNYYHKMIIKGHFNNHLHSQSHCLGLVISVNVDSSSVDIKDLASFRPFLWVLYKQYG